MWRRLDASGDIFAYFEDHLGSSRKMREIASGATTSTAAYDADFYPFGREHTLTNGSPIYKFEGKIRDTETGLDDFGARYYSFTIGRFISADWSAVPAPVPYANLTNPQTLNLYAMVSDNPETFADLDGHTAQYDLTPSGTCEGECNGTNAAPGSADNPDVSDDQNKQPPPSENQNPAPQSAVATGSLLEAAEEEINKVVKPLIESAFEDSAKALPEIIDIGSKVLGPVVGVVTILDPQRPVARDEDYLNKAKLGPSGKPKVHNKDFPTKKRAKDAARNAGGGPPLKHASPRRGSPHFHPTDRQGNKIPGVHYNYPDGAL